MSYWYSIAVVAHTARLERAGRLAHSLQARTFLDDGKLGASGNHRQAWKWLASQDSEWGVVLEDDALPGRDFCSQLSEALQKAPTDIVSLYLGRERPRFIQERAAIATRGPECWITADRLYHGVGVAVKTEEIPEMNESLKYLTQIMPIDEAIGSWAYRSNRKIGYTNPSLVDHDWKIPSIATSHLPEVERRAWRLGTRVLWNSSVSSL